MTHEPIHVRKGEPLILPGGHQVLPAKAGGTASAVRKEELEAEKEIVEALDDPFDSAVAQPFVRTLADVWEPDAKKFSSVMAVTALSIWGLDASSIARLLNASVEAVEGMLSSDGVSRARKEIIEAVRYAETGTVHGFLAQKAMKAARTVVGGLSAKSMDHRLAAAKDILDRSGFRPADRVEHTMRFEDDMRIVIVKDDNKKLIDVGVE